MKRTHLPLKTLLLCGVLLQLAPRVASAMAGGDPVVGGSGYVLAYGVDGSVVCNPGGASDCP